MFATLAFAVAVSQPATHLTIQPWNGKDLLTTTAAAVKYRLLVAGKPKATIELQTSGVAQGWLAAFCTPSVCAPTRVDVTLPASGQTVLQFELIREAEGSPNRSGAVIFTADGASVRAPEATR